MSIPEEEKKEVFEMSDQKCSAFIGLEILHDTKARRIFQRSLFFNKMFENR
jgi:hypothetical protein